MQMSLFVAAGHLANTSQRSLYHTVSTTARTKIWALFTTVLLVGLGIIVGSLLLALYGGWLGICAALLLLFLDTYVLSYAYLIWADLTNHDLP